MILKSGLKTIVKEWLNFLLSPDFNIIRSPKSYNSQVGVPLSVISINGKHNLGIFEAGISKMNEMEKLEVIIKPTIGVITNIGSAHDEGFADLDKKINEKLNLFKHSKIIIYQKNKAVDGLINPKIKTFSWSYDDETADVLISKKEIEDKTIIQIQYAKANFDVQIPFQDEASVENAISCLMVLLSFKYGKTTIQNRMQWLYPVEMRLKVKNGINNTTLIDDSYSSDFQSLKIALDFKSEDILEIMALAQFRISQHEISAFFRRPDHKHYRLCKDQILRNFLKGVQQKYRPNPPADET